VLLGSYYIGKSTRKEGEPERMLEAILSHEKVVVIYRTFQEVKVPSGRTFQGYLVFHGIPRATQVKFEFQTLTSVKGNQFETQ